MTKPVAVVTEPIHQVGIDLLATVFEVRNDYDSYLDQHTLDDAVASADAVIMRSAPITADALRRSTDLRVIAKHGAGLDSVDVAAATELGVVVANSGDANAGSVAEHAVALMLAVLHQIPRTDARVRNAEFRRPGEVILGDLSEATVGLVGFGHIARRVAQICIAGFGATVLALDPFVSAEEMSAAGVIKAVDLIDLLPRCDILSLHVPLTPDTRHLIGADELKMLGRDCVLINTARGGVVDEHALLASLDAGELRGAGLDVLEHEPPRSGDPLFGSDRVVLSPHVGGGTELARQRMARAAAQAAIDVVEGRRPAHVVNVEVLEHPRAHLDGDR
ncbi:hydroxyacid dehydrogenase [Gordonia sp. ABSL11-1]|uniref:hydroxyacid dehydrogenase n=1 Tax=Gordonia sp. ABSL11-1 TaxID=3053924 RepID=UPI002572CB17|nr:hydroxyacid dehydrogenase [Gordonia sp. ABSL11-1]MDL9948147.1 hydroxyacid dehydrogenase [Gordonia sp. ABSL11-1]